MSDFFKKFFFAPIFDDERKNRAARYLNSILNISFVLIAVLVLSGQYAFIVNLVFVLIALFVLSMHFLLYAGKVELTSTIFILIIWLSMTSLAWVGGGIKDFSLIIYLILIFLASLLGYAQLSAILIGISIFSIWSLFYAETTGLFTPISETLLADSFSLTSIFLLFGAILYFTIKDLDNALLTSQENEQELLARNETLLQLQEDLQENARNLKKTSDESQAQALRLQRISKVTQKITLAMNMETLLPEIAKLTSESFGFYHVGIFLLNANDKYAQLKAANSEGGQKMLARAHRLEVGHTSLVGRVAYERKARILLDVDEKLGYSTDADLPDTHSEMALPLVYGDELLGVLDVQSKKRLAFDEFDVEAFSILANQIAISIENARQLERTQNALKEIEDVSRQYIRQEWSQLLRSRRDSGFRYLHGDVETIEDNQVEEAEDVEESTPIIIPAKLRNEIIGTLKIYPSNKNQVWQEDDIELIQAIADRAALALENARLLETTTRRAQRERLVSEVTTKIRSTNDPDVMVRSAMDELKKILGASKVELQAYQPKDAQTESRQDE